MWKFEYMEHPYRSEWVKSEFKYGTKEDAAEHAAKFLCVTPPSLRMAVRLVRLHVEGE